MDETMKAIFCAAIDSYQEYLNLPTDFLLLQLHADKVIYCYENLLPAMTLYSWILFEESRREFITYEEYQAGYMPYVETKRITKASSKKKFVVNEEAIRQQCEALGLTFNLTQNMLFIRTPVSTWQILFNEDCIRKVYHEDFHRNRQKMHKLQDGYHRQKKQFKTMQEAIQYVYQHDRAFMRKNYRMTRKVKAYY